MRKILVAVAMLGLIAPAFAADGVGTWKLNTQKSTGPVVAAFDLVAVDEGDSQIIDVTDKNGDGSPLITKFSIPLRGGEGKIIDAAPFTGLKAKPISATTQDFLFMLSGKPAMHIHSVLSPDGKVMRTTRKVMRGPMKPGTYVDVWERQ